jgi:hypothetical protein
VRRARRVDANQREIVAALRAAGRTVEVLSDVGRGVPDLLVSVCGRNYLLEVKAGKAGLTQDEARWHAAWRGQVAVVRTPQEAIEATR